DEQDHDRRVEEDDDEREEDPQQPRAVLRQCSVHYAASNCGARRNLANTSVRTATTASRKSARTDPVSQSGKPVSKRSTIWFPYMYPEAPPTSDGVMNSPSVGMKTKRKAATSPGTDSGSVTRRNACHRLAPRSLAASSKRRSRLSSETKLGKATNGSHTYPST